MKAQRKILRLAALTFISLVTNISFSQPHTEWIQRYNSSENYNEDLIDMALDKNGNVYVTGNTGSPSDIVTIKYSSGGNLEWVKTYNGPANRDDHAIKIAVDDSGFVYVVGETFRPNEFSNYLTIKYSNNGNVIWQKELANGDSTVDSPHDMVLDDSSNIYISGYGYQCLKCFGDYLTVKYDRNGNLKWKKFYHGEGYFSNYGWTLAVDKSYRVIVSGVSADINNTNYNATIVYNPNGDLLNILKYDSAEVRRICTDVFNNIYIGGNVKRTNFENQWDFFLNKYDSSGLLLWNKTYNTPFTQQRNDYFSWMTIDVENKNVYYTGNTVYFNQNGYNYVLFKYNSGGDSIWKRGYTPIANSSNTPIYLSKDKYDNFYITGSSDFNTPFYRIMTVKYDSAGSLQWVQSYANNLFANNYGKRVLIDSVNSIYVGGISYDPGTNSNDIVIIKYSQVLDINKFSNNVVNNFNLFQNYPNPFNPSTRISYSLPNVQYMLLKVYDVLGNEIATLVNKKQNPGNYEIEFDGSHFASGVYFYNLEIDGKIVGTKRMLLLK